MSSMTHSHRALWLQARRVASGPEGRGPAVLQLSQWALWRSPRSFVLLGSGLMTVDVQLRVVD